MPEAKLPDLTEPPSAENDILQKSKWDEVNSLIDEIKIQNPPRHIILTGSLGFSQVISNSLGDPVRLGLNNNMPSIGLTAIGNFFGNVGLETKFVYAQNVIPADGSPNTASTFIYWLDAGPRYTFFLDESRREDNLSVKILFHINQANFVLTDPQLCMINRYMGISGSVERSIPITRKLGLIASLDLLQIFQAVPASNSQIGVVQSGYGFELKGELYYILELGKLTTRLGFAYWQQGNDNELSTTAKENFGKNSFFQVARSLFFSGSLLF